MPLLTCQDCGARFPASEEEVRIANELEGEGVVCEPCRLFALEQARRAVLSDG